MPVILLLLYEKRFYNICSFTQQTQSLINAFYVMKEAILFIL